MSNTIFKTAQWTVYKSGRPLRPICGDIQGDFRRKDQYFWRWQYQSFWEKDHVNRCLILCIYINNTSWIYKYKSIVISNFSMAQQTLVGQCLLIIGISRLHSDTPKSVALLWTSDGSDAETSTWQHTTIRQPFMSSVGFQAAVSSSERP
jgi:hypothetical protein